MTAKGYTLPTGVWAVTRTKTSDPYPCRCHGRNGCRTVRNPTHCPCSGRTDIDNLPAGCCAKPRPQPSE